jgi:hypothetical protein
MEEQIVRTTADLKNAILAPDKSGDLNGSMQHSTQTQIR